MTESINEDEPEQVDDSLWDDHSDCSQCNGWDDDYQRGMDPWVVREQRRNRVRSRRKRRGW